MKQRCAGILALVAVLLVVGLGVWRVMGAHHDTENPEGAKPAMASPRATGNGLPTVILSPAAQTQSGVQVQALPLAHYQPQTSAYGVIIDPQPLFDLHTRYQTITAQIVATRVAAATSQREYQRLRLLNREGQNASDQAVQTAHAAWQAAQARLTGARATLNNLESLANTQWGTVLARWVMHRTSRSSAALFNGHSALLLVTLPLGRHLSVAPPVISVATGDASTRVTAQFISPSPQSDPQLQGATYFYDLSTPSVRIGMRVTVELPLAKHTQHGIVIPASAVLWYANRAWVYRQIDQNRFVRQRVSTQTPVAGGWFETDLKPKPRIVVHGAQLLLSQELQSAPTSPSPGGGDDDGD